MKKLTLSDIEVSAWLNTKGDFKIPSGKVVAIHAFQMLCPGCVLHGIPQAKKLHAIFGDKDVQVLGLHTVFEHHEAMQNPSLKAFLHEFRVDFPVGVDVSSGHGIPKTMEKFQLQGTPSWMIFDRKGELRIQHFGALEDMVLGAEVSMLTLEIQSKKVSL